MTSRYGNIAHTHQSVWARGVNLKLVCSIFKTKAHLNATGFTDPVALHGFNLIWPAIQFVEVIQKLFCVIGNADKPLWNLFALNDRIAAPAAAVDYLLVGQYRLIIRAPVHGRHFFVRQTFVDQLGEEPLFPAIVLRVTGGQFTIPVVTEAQRFKLAFHVGNVFFGPLRRSHLMLDCSVLCRQTERIPTHWLHHVLALHALIT